MARLKNIWKWTLDSHPFPKIPVPSIIYLSLQVGTQISWFLRTKKNESSSLSFPTSDAQPSSKCYWL